MGPLDVLAEPGASVYGERLARALVIRYVARNVPKAIPIDMATCLYRVTQESLQNVLKHAEASRVEVHAWVPLPAARQEATP